MRLMQKRNACFGRQDLTQKDPRDSFNLLKTGMILYASNSAQNIYDTVNIMHPWKRQFN